MAKKLRAVTGGRPFHATITQILPKAHGKSLSARAIVGYDVDQVSYRAIVSLRKMGTWEFTGGNYISNYLTASTGR